MTQAQHRRRLAAPILDFVAALRDAIAAFAQGEVGTPQTFTLRQIAEINAMLRLPLERSPGDATRLLYLGELSPHGGVVDFLSGAIAWAERHPDVPVELCWAGSGDLLGVLRAQLVPANLRQSFTGTADPGALTALMPRCGLLVVPSLGPIDPVPIAQAMAAGLPVLGSQRCPEVGRLVAAPSTGWLFDPLRPEAVAGVLDQALGTPLEQLADMRVAARRFVRLLCDEHLDTGADAAEPTGPLLAAGGQA